MFTQGALMYTIPALLGTLVFLLKFGFMMIGGAADADLGDVDVDFDLDADAPDVGHGDASTAAFKIASVHTIAAFLMGFGWGGLMGKITFGWPLVGSVFAGLGFGLALMWLMAILLRGMMELQGSGHVRIKDAVGCEGTVYIEVPGRGEGRGRVHVVIGDRARIFNAVTEGEPLERSRRVRIMGVGGDNTLNVIGA